MPRHVEEIDELEELDELTDPDDEPTPPPRRVAKKAPAPVKKAAVAKQKLAAQPAASAADIRAWAAGHKLKFAARGRIHPDLVAAYDADDPDLWKASQGGKTAKPVAAAVAKLASAPVAPKQRVAATNGRATVSTDLSIGGVKLIIDGDVVQISAPGKKVVLQG